MRTSNLFKILFIFSFVIVGNANSACTVDAKEFIQSSYLASYAKESGDFSSASSSERKIVLDAFLHQQKEGSFGVKLDSKNIKRVDSDSLEADFSKLSKASIESYRKSGINNFDELSYVTSGAGLWSRGGGAVKALVPYNIKDILKGQFKDLKLAGDIVAAKKNSDILKLMGRSNVPADEVDKVAKQIKIEAQQKIQKFLKLSKYNTKSVNALDLKLVNVALYSQKTKRGYIPFDIWTSEQTHKDIADYLTWLEDHFREKTFHPDIEVNKDIQNALEEYFKKSSQHNENHLFGYQEGFHAIDVANGRYKEDSASIGKGAGAIVEYLKKSGREEKLRKMGIKDVVFENIEVVSDMAPIYGVFKDSKKKVGVVLVPQKEGYSGGSPFLIRKEIGEWNLELREMTVLDDQFKEGNQFFNSNTIFYSTDIKTPKSTAFELKNQNTEARVKLNMGDVTFENESIGIGGRVGRENSMVEYENFKNYGEYGTNGSWYVEVHQNNWKQLISQGRYPASQFKNN